jgi:glucans biosynthesis protein C
MHALDGLRGTMMLLGLVVHTGASYTVADHGALWPYNDPATTFGADLVVGFIHIFRMPIFFVLAGFFAAMLHYRRGAAGLLKNRAERILLPFLVALVVLYPLVIGGFTFTNAASAASISQGWAAFVESWRTSAFDLPARTIHLWFLYHLLYFYLFATLAAAVAKRLPRSWREAASSAFRTLVSQPALRVLLPALITAATLIPMGGELATSTAFAPGMLVLAGYGVFFAFGWLLYREHDVLPSFMRLAWPLTLAAAALFFLVLFSQLTFTGGGVSSFARLVLKSLTGGLVIWMLFFGFTGLFLRYFDRPSPSVRYIVDASYWVYLVHLPATIWIPGLLVNTGLAAWPRVLIVISGTTVIGFGTYALFVRATVIGRVLNGRRYPRGLPATRRAELQEGKVITTPSSVRSATP